MCAHAVKHGQVHCQRAVLTTCSRSKPCLKPKAVLCKVESKTNGKCRLQLENRSWFGRLSENSPASTLPSSLLTMPFSESFLDLLLPREVSPLSELAFPLLGAAFSFAELPALRPEGLFCLAFIVLYIKSDLHLSSLISCSTLGKQSFRSTTNVWQMLSYVVPPVASVHILQMQQLRRGNRGLHYHCSRTEKHQLSSLLESPLKV